MAGMKLFERLPASSILEVTVAMVLILAIFTSAMFIYLNITSAHPQLRKFKYEAYLESAAHEAIKNKSLINSEWKDESVTIYKTVMPYQGNPHLMQLSLSAQDGSGKTVARFNTLVYVPGL